MTREAFEKWHGGRYRGYQEEIAFAAWQAATAHASDVAAEIVLHELDGNGQAEAINIAIKEALK